MKSKKTNPVKFFNDNKAMAKAKAGMEMKKFKKSLPKAQDGIVGPKPFISAILDEERQFAPTPSGYRDPKSDRQNEDMYNLKLRRSQRQQEDIQQGLKQQLLNKVLQDQNKILSSIATPITEIQSMNVGIAPYEKLKRKPLEPRKNTLIKNKKGGSVKRKKK